MSAFGGKARESGYGRASKEETVWCGRRKVGEVSVRKALRVAEKLRPFIVVVVGLWFRCGYREIRCGGFVCPGMGMVV